MHSCLHSLKVGYTLIVWSFYVKPIGRRALSSQHHGQVFPMQEWRDSGAVLHNAASPVSWPHPQVEDQLCAGHLAGGILCYMYIFNVLYQPSMKVVLILPFYSWGNWASQGVSRCPKTASASGVVGRGAAESKPQSRTLAFITVPYCFLKVSFHSISSSSHSPVLISTQLALNKWFFK